jgi:hypothetical protein
MSESPLQTAISPMGKKTQKNSFLDKILPVATFLLNIRNDIEIKRNPASANSAVHLYPTIKTGGSKVDAKPTKRRHGQLAITNPPNLFICIIKIEINGSTRKSICQ